MVTTHKPCVLRRSMLCLPALMACLVLGSVATNLHGVEAVATHKQVRSIVPRSNNQPAHLNTFCVGPDRLLYLCCAPSHASQSSSGAGAILVYSGDGELVREIPLEFVPEAINFGPDGKCFVAGSGKIARLSSEGAVEIVKDAPNIGNREEMIEELKKAAEAQKKAMTESYSQQLEQIESQLKRVRKEIADADPADEKGDKKRQRRLKMLEQQQDQWKSIIEQFDESYALQSDDAVLGRMMRATGIAVSKEDVFVSLPKATGYGYSIHRLDHELENPTVVVKDVGGCCGQLDIQSDGENLLIAENTAFKVGVYDRDGKRQDSWGQRGRDKSDGFGSCCNPMNVRCCENGDILTAESSIGDIKRFSKDGKFLGLVGRASVGGGCKHVAIGWDTSRDWHYMMNQDKSSIAVLVPKDQAPGETEEEQQSRLAMEGLGRKLLGTWEIVDAPAQRADESDVGSMDSYILQAYAHLEFAGDGSMAARPVIKTQPAPKAETAPEDKSNASDNEPGVIGALVAGVLSAVSASSTSSATDDAMANAVASRMQRKSTWKALAQRGDQLDFVMIEQDVQSYGATVNWIQEDQIELSWFYGSPESKISQRAVRYQRISCNACGQTCDSQAPTSDKAAAVSDGQ